MNKSTKIAALLMVVALLLVTVEQVWDPLHEQELKLDSPCYVALSGNDNGYFIDRCAPVGFQLDLLNAFSDHIGVPFRFVVANNPAERLQLLEDGKVTIAAFSCKPDSLPHAKDIAFSLPLDTVTRAIWATRKRDEKLRQSIEQFFVGFTQTDIYRGIRWKYFDAKTKGIEQVANRTTLSSYDDVLKECGKELGWDWRILASLIFQESRFQPNLTSRKGAHGIMQLMPSAAARYGVNSSSPPEAQIRAGTRILKKFQQELANDPEITDSEERIKFVLAAYNAGPSRISGCRKFARMLGKNAGKWDDVASVMPLMEQPEPYGSDSLPYKRFKGAKETLNFVTDIMERYYHYRNLVEE